MVQWSSASHWPADEAPRDRRAESCQRLAVFLSPSCRVRICFCVGVDGLFVPCSRPLRAALYGPLPHRLHRTLPRWIGSLSAFFHNSTTQLSRHLIGITLIDGQLVCDLLV